ncbi:MAG TPA: hypothetical protein DCL77_12830 [Prolixibacteraceae bacterium]|jgi:hypothetical protein|nr:hypothetical protein [Prolixibacteraceae bacterium]
METLIVQPDSKEKLDAIKAFMKALKIPFEASKSPYNPDFVAKIKQGDEDIKAGRTKKISLDDIWK